MYGILKCRQYGDILETVVAAGRRRVTRESFEKFLASQDRFHLAPAGSPPAEEAETEDPGNLEEPGPEGEGPSGNLDAVGQDASFLTMSMAAEMAGISRQAVSKALGRGCFPGIKQSGIIRIPREGFEAWLESRKNEVNYGNNQKA